MWPLAFAYFSLLYYEVRRVRTGDRFRATTFCRSRKIRFGDDHRRRITHPRQTTDACRLTDALPSRPETAVAHRQSIHHPFEKSAGDGSSGKSLSAN